MRRGYRWSDHGEIHRRPFIYWSPIIYGLYPIGYNPRNPRNFYRIQTVEVMPIGCIQTVYSYNSEMMTDRQKDRHEEPHLFWKAWNANCEWKFRFWTMKIFHVPKAIARLPTAFQAKQDNLQKPYTFYKPLKASRLSVFQTTLFERMKKYGRKYIFPPTV